MNSFSKFTHLIVLIALFLQCATISDAHKPMVSKKAKHLAESFKPSHSKNNDWIIPKEITPVDESVMTVSPQYVKTGTFSDDKPVPGPPVTPKMVNHGDLARLHPVNVPESDADIELDVLLAKNSVSACMVVENTKDLAKFLYSLEPEDQHDGTSEKHVMDLVKVVCPALKTKFPTCTKDLKCEEVYKTITNAYHDKYIGLVPLKPCDEDNSGTANFAMLQLLQSSRTFFGWDECKPAGYDIDLEDEEVRSEIPSLFEDIEALENTVASAIN